VRLLSSGGRPSAVVTRMSPPSIFKSFTVVPPPPGQFFDTYRGFDLSFHPDLCPPLMSLVLPHRTRTIFPRFCLAHGSPAKIFPCISFSIRTRGPSCTLRVPSCEFELFEACLSVLSFFEDWPSSYIYFSGHCFDPLDSLQVGRPDCFFYQEIHPNWFHEDRLGSGRQRFFFLPFLFSHMAFGF